MHKLKSEYIKLNVQQRLYHCEKPIIALTGGIATGKSTVSNILAEQGIPLVDADKLVKEIYALEKSKSFISSLDSSFLTKDKINFPELRKAFFTDQNLKLKIEEYIYQELPKAFKNAYENLSFEKWDFLIYDIPLLHEKNLTGFFDANILVYAPQSVQKERLILRDQCSNEVADNIIQQQIDIDRKRQKSQIVIDNSRDLKHLNTETQRIIKYLTRS